MPEPQRERSVVLVIYAEKIVVKCNVTSPKGKQRSLISVIYPHTTV